MSDKTCGHKNYCRWDNLHAIGDHVDRSNPEESSSVKVKRTSEHFSSYSSDDLRSTIQPPCSRQYQPGNFVGIRPLDWDEIFEGDDDAEKWMDHGASSGERSCPPDGNDNDNGKGEEDAEAGEKGTRKGNGTKDDRGQGNGMGK